MKTIPKNILNLGEATVHDVVRKFYLMNLPDPQSWPDSLDLKSKKFGLLIAYTPDSLEQSSIEFMAKKIINQGAVAISFLGHYSNKLELIFDEASVHKSIKENEEAPLGIITTAVEDGLKEGLWEFIYASVIPEAYEKECTTWLVVTFGKTDEEKEIEKIFEEVISKK